MSKKAQIIAIKNQLSLESELDIREKYWMAYKGCHTNSVGKTLNAMAHNIFINIEVSLRILAMPPSTLSLTSCASESEDLKNIIEIPSWVIDLHLCISIRSLGLISMKSLGSLMGPHKHNYLISYFNLITV